MSGDAAFPFEIVSEREVLDHPYLRLSLLTARDAQGRTFEALRGGGPDLVYVVPLWPDGTVTLVRTHRFGIDGTSLEVPGGHVEDGEAPLAAAQRELREEAGLTGGDVVHLFTCLLSAKIQQLVHVHLARDLAACDQDLDVGETSEPVRLPLAEAVALATSGGIRQGMSVLALLAAARHAGT